MWPPALPPRTWLQADRRVLACRFLHRTRRLSAFMLSRAKKEAAMEEAAMLVQTAWRRRQGKLSVMVLKQARAMRRADMERAAKYLQRVYRGHRGRRMFMALLDHIAVLKLKKGDLQVRVMRATGAACRRALRREDWGAVAVAARVGRTTDM